MSTNTTWDDYRPEDGTALTIDFDWYDDFSSWRLEEMVDQIAEAKDILAKKGIEHGTVNHIGDLEPIVKDLRVIHRDMNIDDATVRKALSLADDLDIRDDGADASFEYEAVTDNIAEILDAWDDAHPWRFSDDEWDVSAADCFKKCQQSRNGLGDRWSISFHDDRVEMPDGTIVSGLAPDKAVQELVENIDISEYTTSEGELEAMALAFAKVNVADLPVFSHFLEIIEDRDMLHRLDGAAVEALSALIARTPVAQIDVVLEMVEGLALEWSGTLVELLHASETLLGHTVAC